MRLFELLQSLSPAEVRDFDLVMKNHKRDSTLRLLEILKKALKTERIPDKTELQLELYGKTSDKSRDYLLRNELRLLSDALTDFLVMRKFEAKMQKDGAIKDRYLMEIYREKGLQSHLETRFKRGFSAAKKAGKYDFAAELVSQYQEYVINSKEIHAGLLEGLIQFQQEQISLLQTAFVDKIRYAEAKMAGAYRILKISNPALLPPTPLAQIDLNDAKINSPNARYLKNFAAAYMLSGKDRIQLLTDGLRHAEQDTGDRKTDNQVMVLASIALEHFLMGSYSDADHWYERLDALARKNKRPLRLEIIFNYVSNLIKLKQFQRAVEIFEHYEKAARENERVYFRFCCLAAMAHIFLKNENAAMQLVPNDIHHRPETQYNYFRFIILLVFYLRGDFEDTLREIRNFEQTLALRKSHEVDVRPILRFLREFVQLQQDLPQTRQDRLPGLKKRIEAYADSLPPMLSDFLPFTWLRRKVGADL